AAGGGVKAVLQVGVGGAYPGAGLALGTAAAATSELDLDLGLGRHPDWQGLEALAVHGDATANRIDLAGPLLTRVAAATGTPALPFATSDAVTADAAAAAYVARRFGTAVESMEGAGAARAAAALGVPFVEVRGVSNSVGERDQGAWRLREAVAAAGAAALLGLAALWEGVAGPAGYPAGVRAAAALGVPFVEVRGVSNSVGERDKGAWRLREAVAAAGAAALLGLAALWEVLDGPAG